MLMSSRAELLAEAAAVEHLATLVSYSTDKERLLGQGAALRERAGRLEAPPYRRAKWRFVLVGSLCAAWRLICSK
jgi:hypothetical protein